MPKLAINRILSTFPPYFFLSVSTWDTRCHLSSPPTSRYYVLIMIKYQHTKEVLINVHDFSFLLIHHNYCFCEIFHHETMDAWKYNSGHWIEVWLAIFNVQSFKVLVRKHKYSETYKHFLRSLESTRSRQFYFSHVFRE